MPKNISLLLLSFALFGFSCKKDKSPQDTPEPDPAHEVKVPRVDGKMNVTYNYSITSSEVKLYQAYTLVMFYATSKHPDSLDYFYETKDIGDLTLNDSALAKCCIEPYLTYAYAPQSELQINAIMKNRKWSGSGSALYSPFSFQDNEQLPEYQPAELPDTLYKNKINVIKLGTYSGKNAIDVIVKFGNDRTRIKKISRNATEVTFDGSDFGPFFGFEDTKVTIQFTLENSTLKTIDGRTFCLNSKMVYETKPIYFKF